MTRVDFCHVACHVGLNSTSTNQRLTRVICATWQSGPCARRTFPGCCANPPTHPPPTHHLPGCFWEVPRVFGSSPGVLGSSRDVRGCYGCFGKFRVCLGSSGCVWEVPRVCLESSGCFWEVPRVSWEVPVRFRKFPGVLKSCRVLGPKKRVLRSFVCKKI
jgi:hypothetical protein